MSNSIKRCVFDLLYMYVTGIICAEGTVWREQRKCSISWLRQLGMVKMQTDPRRNDLGNRIMRNVHLAVQVNSFPI